MNEYEQNVAIFLYMSQDLGLILTRDDYLEMMQELIDSTNIWRYDSEILSRVERLYILGELPYGGPDLGEEWH